VTRSLKIVLPVALLVAMAAAAWFLVIAPKREEAARLSAEVAAADAELADLQAKVADYTKARERYPRDVATVTRLGKAVPADDDTGSLMVQLDTASRRSGVDFSSIQLTGDAAGAAPAAGNAANQTVTPGATIPGAVVVPGSDVSTMPFTFAFNGDYFGLSSFLARLQRFVTLRDERISVNGRLLRVESISLKPADDGFPHIVAQVKASSFLAPAAKSTPAGGSAAAPSAGGATSTGGGGSTPATPEPTTNANASGAVQ
jgi:Tfp pilus assembly protein PilO